MYIRIRNRNCLFRDRPFDSGLTGRILQRRRETAFHSDRQQTEHEEQRDPLKPVRRVSHAVPNHVNIFTIFHFLSTYPFHTTDQNRQYFPSFSRIRYQRKRNAAIICNIPLHFSAVLHFMSFYTLISAFIPRISLFSSRSLVTVFKELV